jgi:hypothetical protein
MPIELKIVWDGDVPGLDKHRLSLGAFGEPLTTLLQALRRIASNIVGNAIEDQPAEVGRLASEARQLDIEITNLAQSSSGVDCEIAVRTPPRETIPMFQYLPRMAGMELLEAIDSERNGTPKHAQVRKYLRTLPFGLVRQLYLLRENGAEIKKVEFGSMVLAEPNLKAPHLTELRGYVIGVGFEPGRNEIRIKTETSPNLVFSATPQQVEKALSLREGQVKILAVAQDDRSRLLRIQEGRYPWPRASRDEAVFDKWNGLLTRLAQ